MPGMDRDIVLEALSALTDRKVRPYTERKQSHVSVADLTVENLLDTVLLGPKLLNSSLSSLSAWVSSLFLRDDQTGDSEISDLQNKQFVDLDSFLDPQYDCDFREMSDSSACSRGGEPYKRPVGWYRFALKVRNKYPDGNAWLGPKGWRSHSAAGEWPVCFHGTSIEGAKEIASTHYKAGQGQAYGRGIYSTPDIKIAEDYTMSKIFTSKKTGKTYKVIMQNRVNPLKRTLTVKTDYWLIPVPVGSTAEQEKEIVESSIRPYGILIKEVESVNNSVTHN